MKSAILEEEKNHEKMVDVINKEDEIISRKTEVDCGL
jgi:hypothetical protein